MALGPSVTSRLMVLSPSEAHQLSQKFYSTTKVDPKLIRAYGDDMRAGRWLTNGASIVISSDGRVLDGRMRILASVQSQCSFKTLVVEGVEVSAFETIDSVRKRKLADFLSIRKVQHGRALGAALKIIWLYMNGCVGDGRTVSTITLLDMIESHPEIRDSILPGLRATPLVPHGPAIALHYLFSLSDPAKCDAFYRQLAGEVPVRPGMPVFHLRKVLSELRDIGGIRRQTYILTVAVKAWNAFYHDREIKLLKVDPGREAFPKITGLTDFTGVVDGAGPLFERDVEVKSGNADDLRASVELIDAAVAEKLLSNNELNRKISGVVVDKYARDMRDGRWRLNGQTIKISASGKLMDGQHRLEAVKKAGRPFYAIVVRGVPETAFGSLDVGRRRALGEVLRDQGETNTSILASGLRWFWMFKYGYVLSANISPTNGELLEVLAKNPGIRDSVKFTSQIREIMGGGLAAALHYRFGRIEPALADEFFSRLIDGIDLSAVSPIYHLRERLLRTRAVYRIRISDGERAALAIKAWNAFKEHRPLQILAWRNKGPAREALPEIV